MAYATRTYSPGSLSTTFALTTAGGDPIGYIQESDISVKVNGTTYTNAASGANTYQISGASTVEQPSGGNVVLNAAVTGTVVLARTTAIQGATVVYTAGSTLTSTDLNNADNQIRFGLQEFSDDYESLFTGTGDLTGLGAFLGGSDTWVSNDAKAATTAAIDGQIDVKTAAKVKDDIIATAPVSIADDSPSSGKITISVDAELTELATMSTGTAQALADLTGTEVQILDGATVTTDQLNRVDATSSIQTQIDGKQASDAELTELATMASGTASALADLTQTEVEILDGCTRTTAQLNYVDASSSIQTQIDAKQPLDAELTELATMGSTTASALADLTQAEVQILDGATVTTAELNVLDNIPATLTPTELGYVDGVTSSIQTQLDAKQPLDADLTTLAGMQGATASVLAGGTALTSTLTELNQLDGKTLGETTLTTNSDTNIPTSKAVNDRILTVTNALGGFVAIDNRSSFPNTHPDPGGDAGTVVSIADIGGLVVNSSGVATNAATVGGTAVTINGIATNFRSTTMTSGVGMQVQTTSTLNTYDYHTAILRDSDISSISTDIEDFGNRYRVGSSDPGTDNHDGDLFFNTNSATMKVYEGSSWGEVTSVGDFKYLFLCPAGGSGAPTYGGAVYDLRETSNTGTGASVTSAAQLIVSINGVIQKANPGTNPAGLDGFVMSASDEITFCANIQSTDDVFIIQVGSAVTINAPANNTVATDTLQSQAVTEAKMLISNAPSDGKFLQYKDSSDKLTWADVDLTTKFNKSGDTLTGDSTIASGVTNKNIDIDINNADTLIRFDDDLRATFGDSDDLQILHDGTSNQIKSINGKIVVSTTASNSDIEITPNGTGDVVIDGLKYPQADGTAGQRLTTNGSAQLSWEDVSSGGIGKNLFINGSMRIDQRYGGSAHTIDGSDYVLDRWLFQGAGVEEQPTIQQVDVTADSAPWNAGFRKAAKITNGNQTGGASGDDTIIQLYKFEAQDIANSGWDYTSASSYITLSFWVKASVAQDYPFYIRTRDGSAYMYSTMTGSLTADTWTKITKTLPGNSNITVNNDNGSGLELLIAPYYGTDGTVSSGSTLNAWKAWTSSSRWNDITTTWYTTNDATFETTGFKLEVGDSATDIDYISYGEELDRCQRYYQIYWSGSGEGIATTANWGSGASYGAVRWIKEMKTAPSVTVSSGGHFKLRSTSGDTTAGSLTFSSTKTNSSRIGVEGISGATDGNAGWVGTTSGSAKITLESEL